MAAWKLLATNAKLDRRVVVLDKDKCFYEGNPEAEAKRQIIGIVIAAVLIFGAKLIVNAIIALVPGASF